MAYCTLKTITMANKLSKPWTLVGDFENFCPKASDMLCAGSVDKRSTDSRTLASWMAKLQLKTQTTNQEPY